MSEINGPKISVNQVNFQSLPKQESEIPTDAPEIEQPQLKDFGNPKAEALGRSMLVKGADNVNHDLNALLEHPQIAENSDKMFETALKTAQQAGIANPYEEAASFSTGKI